MYATLRSARRRRALTALVATCASLIVPASASAAILNTESLFQFGSGETGLTDLHEPFYIYQTAAGVQWTSSASLSNGSTDVATSLFKVVGLTTNPDGSLTGQLVWKVTAPGTSSSPENGNGCTTNASYSQCYRSVTIPAGFQPDQLRLTMIASQGGGLYDWNAALIPASGVQINVGIIVVPGATVVDPGLFIDQTQTVSSFSSCSAIPQSNVSWLPVWDGTTRVAGVYDGSSNANNSCNVLFTPLASGKNPNWGVNVIAPYGY